MIPQITTFSRPAAIVRYTIQVLYLTESEAFLKSRDHRKCPLPDNSAVPCRGYTFGTFPDEEELESTWEKKNIFRGTGTSPFASCGLSVKKTSTNGVLLKAKDRTVPDWQL